QGVSEGCRSWPPSRRPNPDYSSSSRVRRSKPRRRSDLGRTRSVSVLTRSILKEGPQARLIRHVPGHQPAWYGPRLNRQTKLFLAALDIDERAIYTGLDRVEPEPVDRGHLVADAHGIRAHRKIANDAVVNTEPGLSRGTVRVQCGDPAVFDVDAEVGETSPAIFRRETERSQSCSNLGQLLAIDPGRKN